MGDKSNRPTLPPIRDLFQDELFSQYRQPSRTHNPPLPALAHLHVSDDRDDHLSRHSSPRPTRMLLRQDTHLESMDSRPGASTDRYGEYPKLNTSPSSTANSSTHYLEPGISSISPPYYQIPIHQRMKSSYPPQPPSEFKQYGTDQSAHQRAEYSNPAGFHEQSDNSPVTHSSQRLTTMSPGVGITHQRRDENLTTIRAFQRASSSAASPVSSSNELISASGSRYECSFCGKGFARPSSLKTHLNSHTGMKPFTCPFDGCGKSFSVLSNMRRHTRVHNHPRRQDAYSDDGDESDAPFAPSALSRPSAFTSSSSSAISSSADATGKRHLHRSPSILSSSSRGDYSAAPDGDHLDKRSRHDSDWQ